MLVRFGAGCGTDVVSLHPPVRIGRTRQTHPLMMNVDDPLTHGRDVAPSWIGTALASSWPALAAHAGAMLAAKDGDSGRYVWADPALEAAWGLREGGAAGRTDAELFGGSAAASLRAADQMALASPGELLAAEHRLEVGGQRSDFAVLRLVLPPASGAARRLLAIWADQGPQRQRDARLHQALAQLEQLQQAHEALRRELHEHALRDAGTGLYTRGHFDDQLRREVDLSTREHREFALVLIEIDPPAPPVQALGSAATARIHEALGRLLRGNTRAMDASCRIDARRFAVLLSGVGLATAHARMEGLRRQCATQIVVHEGQDLGFTVAMGVASFPHTAHSQEELVQACEQALAQARQRGGNHVTLASIRFDPA